MARVRHVEDGSKTPSVVQRLAWVGYLLVSNLAAGGGLWAQITAHRGGNFLLSACSFRLEWTVYRQMRVPRVGDLRQCSSPTCSSWGSGIELQFGGNTRRLSFKRAGDNGRRARWGFVIRPPGMPQLSKSKVKHISSWVPRSRTGAGWLRGCPAIVQDSSISQGAGVVTPRQSAQGTVHQGGIQELKRHLRRSAARTRR